MPCRRDLIARLGFLSESGSSVYTAEATALLPFDRVKGKRPLVIQLGTLATGHEFSTILGSTCKLWKVENPSVLCINHERRFYLCVSLLSRSAHVPIFLLLIARLDGENGPVRVPRT